MMSKPAVSALLGVWFCIAGTVAGADIYKANDAIARKDFAAAFETYRELAQIGEPGAQGNLAIMYVSGEGVARDNVMGYAWALVARKNGVEGVQTIIEQMEPRLDEAARARATRLMAQFGPEALQRQLLPVERAAVTRPDSSHCKLKMAADPDKFYPADAKLRKISGTVLMESRVAADGSVRAPLAWFSFPLGVFEEAGRAVALNNRYVPKIENGVAVRCSVLFRVHFTIDSGGLRAPGSALTKDQIEAASELRQKAAAGDPNSQLAYGLAMFMRSALKPEDDQPIRWFLKAAQAGLPAAQYLVGAHLIASSSVEADPRKAALWLEMAAKSGNGAARTSLARYLLGAERDTASHEQGLIWMERAAEVKHREGTFLLAALLATWPEPTRRDPARALKLLAEVGPFFDYDPTLFEIRAAAQASTGDFADAQKSQARALTVAKRLGWDTAALKSRLELYQRDQAFSGALIEF